MNLKGLKLYHYTSQASVANNAHVLSFADMFWFLEEPQMVLIKS